MTHTLPDLGYDFNALEPFIDEETMKIHHGKHHHGYVDKLNAALEGHDDLKDKDVDELIKDLNSVPEDIRTAVRNNGGGHSNHSFFWKLLKKDTKPDGDFQKALHDKFQSFDAFKEAFSKAAMTRFGSGWAWVVLNNGELEVVSTANQDSPLSEGKIPIIGLDVWEHSYYLKYQNRRPEYIEAFFSVLNWDRANENYLKAKG